MAPLIKGWDALEPRQKQWALLALLLGAGFTILWAIFALTEKPKPSQSPGTGVGGQQRVTNVGVMAPGQQVNPLDSWLGGAGKDVAQLKQDRDAMLKDKDEQKAFNRDVLAKFEQLQQKLSQTPIPAPPAATPAPLPRRRRPPICRRRHCRRGPGRRQRAIRRDCRPAWQRRLAWGSRA